MTDDRFIIVPCEAPEAAGLSVIWDRQEQQVIDVMTKTEIEAYSLQGGGL